MTNAVAPLTAPFAAFERQTDEAVMRHLANTTASVDGRDPVLVIFDDPHTTVLGGLMEASAPELRALTTQLGAVAHGATVVVQGRGTYTVAEHRPDGAGMTVLLLERAA